MPARKPSKILPWFQTNQALGAILSLLFLGLLGYVLLSPWMFRPQRDGFLLGFIPLLATCLMLLLTVAMIFDAQRKKPAREGSESAVSVSAASLGYALVVLIATGLYFVAVLAAGFVIVTPVFLFAAVLVLGARPWGLALVFAVAVTGLVYLMFSALGTNLPTGVLFS